MKKFDTFLVGYLTGMAVIFLFLLIFMCSQSHATEISLADPMTLTHLRRMSIQLYNNEAKHLKIPCFKDDPDTTCRKVYVEVIGK